MKETIKNSARNFCREYKVKKLDTHKLKSIIRSQGYSISACLVSVIIAVVGLSVAIPSITAGQKYDTEYYAVPTGSKFHKEDCFYIKDKSTKQRITKDIIDARSLDPCKVCLPELQQTD